MLPLFHTILHFVRQDVKFVDKADFNAEWYLHYFVAFCIRTGFIQEPWISCYDVENDDDDDKQMTENDEESKRGDKSGRPSCRFSLRSRGDRRVCMPKDAFLMLVADSTPFEASFVSNSTCSPAKSSSNSRKKSATCPNQ